MFHFFYSFNVHINTLNSQHVSEYFSKKMNNAFTYDTNNVYDSFSDIEIYTFI